MDLRATTRTRDIWGERAPFGRTETWPERVDEYLMPGVDSADVESWVPSACLLCSNGCGLDIAVAGDRIVGVRGRRSDHVNHGRLGPKGLYGWQGQQHDRLTTPWVRQDGELVPASWDEAMSHLAAHSKRVLDEHGPLSHGFYTSGQLMLEEYYTLAVIGKAGIGTPHMDGNTRLCTATAAAALKESFGSDGQPGTFADIDHCDTLFLFGHNMAETQTVLWARVLDRMAGTSPPQLVCVDPRATEVARQSTLHLPIRPGTNMALVNGLIHELIKNDDVDHEWIAAHTSGYAALARLVSDYGPAQVARICQVPADDIRRAARIFGRGRRVVSTVLQGFYQSHQATAAACGVNNLHLLRGQIGNPGSTVLQMNGQPTAQNTRECGADGDLPGFRNWNNAEHISQLARLWNVDEATIPHWSPPTHAVQLFQHAQQGSIRYLWIAGTNPVVSLPDEAKVREALAGSDCFVVVADAYHTETTAMADVILPAALWGEKTGTFTNTDRTVHLSEQAVPPPAGARSDFDIFLDYARRLELCDRDGGALPAWSTPQDAFDAWRECSRGRPCDYSALSYRRLRDERGIQWPVNAAAPNGTPRLYSDYVFPTATDVCESYGHDIETGGAYSRQEHLASQLNGRARLVAAPFHPPGAYSETEYDWMLVTGRTAYHFHTRTKTGRAKQLNEAAPRAWAQLCHEDATRLGVGQGDFVRVSTDYGFLDLPVEIGEVHARTVFVPFHYGEPVGRSPSPINRLIPMSYDPVSKQPRFKVAAANVAAVGQEMAG